MKNNKNKINHFTDLDAWQKNYKLTHKIYKITKDFPEEEKYGLISQLRRASASVTANIAEGYGRYHYKDKNKFYYQARGSNTEVQNHLILAKDLGYLTEEQFQQLKQITFEGYKLLSGLIKSTKDS